MRLRYHTGIATFVQFIVMSFLSLLNGIESIASSCGSDGSNCVSNSFATIIFFIVISLWFASVWLLGYFAQNRRSRLMAYCLIAVELGIILIATFNIKQDTTLLSSITSFVDIFLALWVIALAFKLGRAKGGRIVASSRQRHKITTKDVYTHTD